MYSFEIKKFLQEHNFRITPLEFMAIINTSPQIKNVYYNESSSIYTIITDDELCIGFEMLEEKPIKKLKLERGDSNGI